ncbi:hypothetical protein QE152_g33350 [Popillia japonica]|uniref:SAM domain-containing protein n=1 Tax=Popillia japonica TaxID=7064 RepID=A0AAW1IWZ3_POPJA
MEKLLQSWGLGEFYGAFEDEGITEESFELLDDETINILFKKSGPRLIFKNKYKEYKRTWFTQEIASSGSSSSSTITVLSDDQYIVDELDDILMPPPQQPLPHVIISESSSLNIISPQEKKRKISQNRLFPDGLEAVLLKYPEGRLALGHRNKLTNDLRQKIAKIVVNELLGLANNKDILNMNLSAPQFMAAADEIVKFFPNEEQDTYYIPFLSPRANQTRQPARGKLWSRYINVRAALRSTKTNLKSQKDIILEICPDDESALNFLKTAVEPYPKILSLWERTYKIRKTIHKKDTLEHIIKAYPCLGTHYGLELLESDFNQEFSDKIDIIYTAWPNVSRAIILEARQRNIETADVTDIDISTHALLILPLLFSPVTIKRGNKENNWRPTRAEVKESFFFHIQNFADLEVVLERRRKKLEQFSIPLQPFGVAVGNINNIESFYVIINDNKYPCNSAIRCLELLYKSIHALNLEYSIESKHVWLFIQEIVYQMPATSKSSSTACVIGDIKFQLQEIETI